MADSELLKSKVTKNPEELPIYIINAHSNTEIKIKIVRENFSIGEVVYIFNKESQKLKPAKVLQYDIHKKQYTVQERSKGTNLTNFVFEGKTKKLKKIKYMIETIDIICNK